MENLTPAEGYELAQQVCKDLCSGQPEAFMQLYNRYQRFLAAFAKRRLFDADPSHVDEILSNYWIELLNGKAICDFKGQASLRTYLTGILNWRIIDANRKSERDKNLRKIIERNEIESESDFRSAQSPENSLLDKENQKLVYSTLMQLEEKSPRDANLIKMHLDGLTYEEMAKAELHDDLNPGKLKKKTDAIKKQFTRNNTGALAKFKSILNRNLEKDSLGIGDLY
jgi:RNA polymerase sigma-70 factor (ECF subfamily)